MSDLFEANGDNIDQGYANLRESASRIERAIRNTLEAMWAVYEPFADTDFRHGFARDLEARFWEMYVGCALLEAGRTLLPAADRHRDGGQPDICVIDGARRIWIEAIAPDCGDDEADQVRGPRPINEGGGVAPAPIRQAQLRVTSALWTKTQVIERYLREGVIGPDDVRLVAIGGSRFGIYAPEEPLPLIMSSVFPFGEQFFNIDRERGEIVGQGFRASHTIERRRGAVPRTAFLDRRFAAISGAIWSRVAMGNMSRGQRPLTFVHNTTARVEMPRRWGVWDREFVVAEHEDGIEATDILSGDS